MDKFPRGKSAIVGAATYGLGEAPGQNSNDMAALAGLKALEQANIPLSDVDGLFVCTRGNILQFVLQRAIHPTSDRALN